MKKANKIIVLLMSAIVLLLCGIGCSDPEPFYPDLEEWKSRVESIEIVYMDEYMEEGRFENGFFTSYCVIPKEEHDVFMETLCSFTFFKLGSTSSAKSERNYIRLIYKDGYSDLIGLYMASSLKPDLSYNGTQPVIDLGNRDDFYLLISKYTIPVLDWWLEKALESGLDIPYREVDSLFVSESEQELTNN